MAQSTPEPRRLSEERLQFIRENRQEPPKKLAKALGVRLKLVEQALCEIGDEDALKRARRRRIARILVALLFLLGVGYKGYRLHEASDHARAEQDAKAREAANRATEKRIYEFLDRREAGHDEEIAQHLTSDDEALRLAATRYVLVVGTGAQLDAALEHVYDKSPRVRLATIQLASKRPCRAVDQVLADVASRPGLDLGERSLALEGLKSRPQRTLLDLASRIYDVLGDPNPTLSRAAHDLLARAFPNAGVPWSADPSVLRSSWRAVFEVLH
jgi:hypothetical protein